MSYPPPPPSPNPYASPMPTGPGMTAFPVGSGQTSMEYMRSYNYIFENPGWMTTVLCLGVVWIAAIIPGVGILLNLLFFGYQFEVIDSLIRTQGRQYPTFDFGRFGDYLGRGVWPFLVNLVATLVLMPVLYIGMIIVGLLVAGIAGAGGDNLGPVLGIACGSVSLILFLAVAFAAGAVMMAMILRSGLAQEFGAAFQFDWISDFMSKMWLEMLLAGLFIMATALVLEIVGLLALCIGIFFVLPLLILAGAHIMYQLYMIYLTRGGMPVPMKMTPAVAQPMVPPGKFPPA